MPLQLILYFHFPCLLQDPLEVSGLPDEIIQISAGYHHSAALSGLELSAYECLIYGMARWSSLLCVYLLVSIYVWVEWLFNSHLVLTTPGYYIDKQNALHSSNLLLTAPFPFFSPSLLQPSSSLLHSLSPNRHATPFPPLFLIHLNKPPLSFLFPAFLLPFINKDPRQQDSRTKHLKNKVREGVVPSTHTVMLAQTVTHMLCLWERCRLCITFHKFWHFFEFLISGRATWNPLIFLKILPYSIICNDWLCITIHTS